MMYHALMRQKSSFGGWGIVHALPWHQLAADDQVSNGQARVGLGVLNSMLGPTFPSDAQAG